MRSCVNRLRTPIIRSDIRSAYQIAKHARFHGRFITHSANQLSHQTNGHFVRNFSHYIMHTDPSVDERSIKGPQRADRIAQMAASQSLNPSINVSVIKPSALTLDSFKHSNNTSDDSIDCFVVFMTEEDASSGQIDFSSINSFINQSITTSMSWIDFKGKSKQTQFLYPSVAAQGGVPRVLLVGLGKSASVDQSTFRSAVHTMTSTLKSKQLRNPLINLHSYKNQSVDLQSFVSIATTISILSNHTFSRKILAESVKPGIQSIKLLVDESANESELASVINQSTIIADCTIFARELSNERADTATPSYIESLSSDIAATHQLIFTCVKDEQLVTEGLNLIRAVGQGAAVNQRGRIITLEYVGDQSSADKIAIVGKMLCHDSGGLNMKPTNSIEDMYLDKAGGCAALAVMKAVALLKPKLNLVVTLATADNAVDACSIKPHTIIDTIKGSVEISNTDAEGRLALADAMTLVQRYHRPHTIIDVATLTGACVMALGETCAGLFTNSDKLASQMTRASDATQEQVWRLPILKAHISSLEGTHSDWRSTGKGAKGGGASVAAAFLQKFVDEGVEWCHLDVAGAAMASEQREWTCRGGTGFGVQLLVEWLRSIEGTSASTGADKSNTL